LEVVEFKWRYGYCYVPNYRTTATATVEFEPGGGVSATNWGFQSVVRSSRPGSEDELEGQVKRVVKEDKVKFFL
jgi:hypothetical protein